MILQNLLFLINIFFNVEKCNRREETRQRNNLLKEKREICVISNTTDSRVLSTIESPNIKTRKELDNNAEELSLNCNEKTRTEIIKVANFEYEEEWNIGGIPELLNELDADIEKSLECIYDSQLDVIKNESNNEQGISKPLQQNYCEKKVASFNLNLSKSAPLLKIKINKNPLEKNSSTFTGFSNKGHLISNSTKSISLCSTTLFKNSAESKKGPKNLNLQKEQGCRISMPSQAGINDNTSSNISGTSINVSCSQNISCSNSSNKINSKMSTDHQATLDKGLKMKIKRTKPGTKTSEAKHEIVKATEQQPNGFVESGTIMSSTSQEDVTCLLSHPSVSSNSQSSNLTIGMNISQSNINLNGNKKNLGNVNNQNNIPSNVGGMSLTNSSSTTSNISQGLPQGTKRGSSVHRRDKTKDKSYHSTRTAIEKNISFANDKESFERPLCFCNCTDGNISTCSCVRKSENNTFAQRMPADNACGSVTVVPPGVFTPSTDTSMSEVISNLLAVTTAVSTTVCTQTLSSDANASIPGSSCKEVFINSSGNAKISSHIAAQLAAAASPNSSTNGSSCTTSSLFPNVEMKSSSSQVVKQLALSPSSTAVTLSVSNQKTLSVSSPTGAEKLTTISTLSSENTVSPPAKRLKHTDKNSASSSSSNKEMVDMCIGTSVGTITEPDCLGPCEPGTSVTLEGIVWHETESGVLVVNVTWRGKTYVGTLLDCTRHDWAPPRFCESPTDDMDTRTPKGRGKRNRTTITPDLSNFTETRSSIYFSHSHVHSKVRNGSNKGGRGTVRTTTSVPTGDKANSSSSLSSGNSGSTPTSPTSFLPPRVEKRKSKDESPPPNSTDTETAKSSTINASGKATSSSVTEGLSSQPQGLIKPLTGLSVQISAKKLKTSSCAISPVLFECPENYCSKKYKHVNGLRYHQTHAHGSTSLIDEDSMTEAEGYTMPQPCSHSSISIPVTPDDSDSTPNNLQSVSSQQLEGPMIEEFTAKEINTSEKCTSETVLSTLPLKDLLALTVPSNTASTTPDASEIIPSELIEQEQEKEQPHNLAESSGMNSLTSSDQTIEKSGVLRFANGESKNNIGLLPTDSVNESFVQMELLTASSPKKFISGLQESNNDAFHSESMDKQTIQPQNLLCIAANKTLPPVLLGAKSEKEKMSSISDYEVNKLNASNISSRGDVQSPAYSDISDDLSPVCEPIHIGKEDDSSTNPDLIKKSQNVSLSATTNCSSTQANISSAVGSYGVYQFYQQQQFIVPNMDEQQQSAKNAVSTNLGSPTNQPNHQQTILEFTTKKDPQIELISKGNLNQPLSNQNYQEINKDTTRTICISGSKGSGELSNVPSSGSSALNTAAPSKSISHFYAFNYVPTNFSINVDQNIENASSPIASEDKKKLNRLPEISNSNNQPQEQHSTIIHKDDQSTEQISSTESDKSAKLQIQSTQTTKHDAIEKSECTKQESACNNVFQAPHMPFSSKDHTNLFQRQSLTMSPQQLSREEELRRYYIFSDQQRRHNSSCHNAINLQIQNTSPLSGIQQCKDDISSSQQHTVNSQQQIKTKGTTNLSINKAGNAGNTSKESPKHKQDEDLKVIKQEGQKPTMESHGPPPPSTSQYFLHPSYITPSPFGFDPNHPMYRNVLMPVTSPYNTSPYHLPISRYHAPEDLSRNTGTKALDALHHAACQYYSTHKIHELSEKALKSPNDSNLSNASSSMKIAGSSPNNISATQLSNIASHGIGQHDVQNQHSSVAQLSHNINLQNIGITNKQEILGQKLPGNGLGITANPPIELSKPQTGVISSAASNCSIESGSCNNGNSVNSGNGSTSDARSPPPQRHVHTHHHTHVGLGYPMYPAPYGAAVLASQQAAAVAVINPFPPGPSK